MKESNKRIGDDTFIDMMLDYMSKDRKIVDKIEMEKLQQFIIYEEYETDTILVDIPMYETPQQSNFYTRFSVFSSMKRFITNYQCMLSFTADSK